LGRKGVTGTVTHQILLAVKPSKKATNATMVFENIPSTPLTTIPAGPQFHKTNQSSSGWKQNAVFCGRLFQAFSAILPARTAQGFDRHMKGRSLGFRSSHIQGYHSF
jgi:hypothetical protein